MIDVPHVFNAYEDRPYHNTAHIHQMVRVLSQFVQIDEKMDVAILFHDYIYKPGDPENEYMSMVFARDYMRMKAKERGVEVNEADMQWVSTAILATKKHMRTGIHDIDLFLDADMSILGMPWDQYDKYRRGVRKEYEAFTDEQFRDGRKQFLLSFSGFITDEFNEVYLDQAKRNIRRELDEFDGIFVTFKPRGTVSVLGELSGGIEPVFAADYIRTVRF